MQSIGIGRALVVLAGLALALTPWVHAQGLGRRLHDRGPGVPVSMFGTYVRKGELLVYPFLEFYVDKDYEYKPAELGFEGNVDYRGRYRATEGLLFLGYGITEDLAIEMEAAVISARLDKAADDPSAMPSRFKESGLGDVEGQIRWRFLRETDSRPEWFTFFETVIPSRPNKRLIGTRDWEFKLGVGLIRGYRWGTMTLRVATEYSAEERKFETGEYAVEYLKRLSQRWRVVALIEGNQIDEVALITEVQWHFLPRAFLKVNSGWGLTRNATGFAPEMGVMISF